VAKKTPLQLSAVSGLGMKEALFAIVREINSAVKKDDPKVSKKDAPWRP
jgi:GTP-binding protein